MTDGFSFHVRFGTGETLSNNIFTGDRASFQGACEAVMAVAAGKGEAEIRELLDGELRSRDIVGLSPHVVNVLAAAIADDGASITFGDRIERDADVPDLQAPGPVGRFFGGIIGRMLAPSAAEAVMKASVISRLLGEVPADLSRYVPEPGREPTPAEVITDPDLGERLPRLLARHQIPELPAMPAMPRSFSFSFSARLEEDGDMLVVSAFPERTVRRGEDGDWLRSASWERIGRLSPAGADVYGAHLRTARLRGQSLALMVAGRMKGRRLLGVTARLI